MPPQCAPATKPLPGAARNCFSCIPSLQSGQLDRVEFSRVSDQPYYLPIGDEVAIFSAAYECRLPVLLKGPTGCGKTRFIEHMAHVLRGAAANGNAEEAPSLITVACHEDLTGSDLVGRYLIKGDETVWIDGPLTQAVKAGAICYLDEIVEARKDTIVLIHPLTDHRRILPIDKKGEILEAHPDFLLVISYNPGYQSVLKDLKHSTRQRFVTIDFDYPPRDKEAQVIAHESGLAIEQAMELAKLGEKVRHLKASGLEEGVSTRLLIYAAQLIGQGVPPRRACGVAVSKSLTDDHESQRAIEELAAAIFP
ncbi:MAG: CbbQ/NirQ/NorQ/GpvN family protein [Deltaproteobacteria bacterium]|nr:CbbQ/NirQ/NorQ/GpvN family protein [Deltaproteobacteria bacterium]